MSIERYHGDISFICDDCGDALDAYTNDFTEAIEVLKMNSWTFIRQKNGDYEHYCPDCSEDDSTELIDSRHSTK